MCSSASTSRLLALALGVAAAGCAATPVPVPDAADAAWAGERWPGHDLGGLVAGRELYVRRCSGCHGLYAPAAVPAARWPRIVDEMATEAGIGPAEREGILRYLLAAGRPGRVATAPPEG